MDGYFTENGGGSGWRVGARYAAAVFFIGLAVVVAQWSEPFVEATVLLLIAVVLAAWFGGLWPAIVSAVLAAAAHDYMFTSPRYELSGAVSNLPHFLMFAALAMLFAGASASRRAAERSLKKVLGELDQTVRERTAELTRSESSLAEAQRLSHIGSWVEDVTAGTFTASPELRRIAGYGAGAVTKDMLRESVHVDDRAHYEEALQNALRAKADFDVEHRLVRPDGSVRHVHVIAHPVVNEVGTLVEVVGSVADITNRKRAEQELEQLAGRLIDAQEQERSRIGRELHDHISQMLGVLTIRLDQLRADEATSETVALVLEELRQNAAEITTEIHNLSHRLHSSALDYLGLVPALQKLVKEFSARHGIQVDFEHASLPAPLPTEVALCLFRIVEESLTNVAKHSQAKSACVRVHGEATGIALSVEDSGRGFEPDRLERQAGLGFVSMRERLRALRGTVRVRSAPARGTSIEVWVPATEGR
jgi:PAS domain S-box-containing protein